MSTIRPKEDQNTWNVIFSVFFLCVVVGAMWEVWGEYSSFPRSVSVFDATIMAFAAFRITRLVVYDKITRWFRELFVHKREFEQDGRTYVEIHPYHHGILGTLHDLLGCPWCIGFWSALMVAFVYYMFPWAWFVILFLALAGAGSLLQLTANMIGWKAENLKLDAQEKEARLKETVDRSSLGK
jgi:hypothetical protein